MNNNDEVVIHDWKQFYEKFGVKLDFGKFKIPKQKLDFTRVLILAKGINHCWLDEVCRTLFETHYHHCPEALDNVDPFHDAYAHDRWPDESYSIRIRDTEWALDKVPDLDPLTIKEMQFKCMTSLERILLEAKYFLETGKHLDYHSSVLCAGSRSIDNGGVVGVRWFHSTVDTRRQLNISWQGPSKQRQTRYTRLVLT